jgi:lipopolysaccharide transport system permease protein
MLPLMGLGLGLGWFLASLGVYVHDVTQVIGVIVQALFFLSAIFYPIESVPAMLRPILFLNPMLTVVDGVRRVLIWNQSLDWGPWLAVTVVAGVTLLLGYVWFMKTKTGFADVI